MLDRFAFYVFPWGKESPNPDDLIELTQYGEKLGFDGVHVPYHLTVPETWLFKQFDNRDMLDPLALIPAMIQATDTIRISLNTAVLPLLNPYVWARHMVTCDVLSKGRFVPGVAIGWWEEEFDVVGVKLKHRGRMTDEALEVMTRLWTEDTVTHDGEFFKLNNVRLDPKPVQKPSMPVLIGGGHASIPRAAKYADYLMPLNLRPDEARDEYRPKLDAAAAEQGREVKLASMHYAVITDDAEWLKEATKTDLQFLVGGSKALPIPPEEVVIMGNPQQAAERAQMLIDAGIDYFILDFQYHGLQSVEFAKEQMQRFAEEVAPLLKG